MPFLELADVGKTYAGACGGTEVLRDINLAIEEGEFVAIVGYSGAGKTTLVSLMAGLLVPSTGRVMLNGKIVEGPGPERAVVFQNYSLLPWLTVYDNIALAVDQVFPKWTRAQRRSHTDRHIELVQLTAAARKRPNELSGGMKQRVALVRALAMDPRVLLMDEPMGALDALTRAVLQVEIERIWTRDRKTVVLITNDVDEGILLADRIIPMSAGPAATLGPCVRVDLPRPRNRKEINHDANFKEIRRQVLGYLLGPGKKRQGLSAAGAASLPALKPADLSSGRSLRFRSVGAVGTLVS